MPHEVASQDSDIATAATQSWGESQVVQRRAGSLVAECLRHVESELYRSAADLPEELEKLHWVSWAVSPCSATQWRQIAITCTCDESVKFLCIDFLNKPSIGIALPPALLYIVLKKKLFSDCVKWTNTLWCNMVCTLFKNRPKSSEEWLFWASSSLRFQYGTFYSNWHMHAGKYME